ncbi:hypoxia inducible factor 1 subunit alpha, like isoform X2 [Amia ocellicauda]|uniref:hypoxia inducible factor 1 subunit alpha, like isoform X2 n=1 Tax=Amia ocellicauda TaxID=2972642 RepID=UPI003464E2CC
MPSSEQRKVRSRDAARSRRSQETEVFYQLAHALPLPRRVAAHLDKAAIMRVTLSYLRINRLLQAGGVSVEEGEGERAAILARAPAGFVMVLSSDGDMVFLSESVNKHIGIPQLDLLGQSVFDFIHPCDQEELRDALTTRLGFSRKQREVPTERSFFLRMKSTLTSRGRTVNIKSASWKVLHCSGHIQTYKPPEQQATTPSDGEAPGFGLPPPQPLTFLTLLCEPIPHPSSLDFPLDSSTFLSRHSLDLKFTHCQGRVSELVGYQPEDLIGRSAYEYHHALDSDHMTKSLQILLSKGQVTTAHYRFLVKTGGFVWAETQASVIYNNKSAQPEGVVCLNYILSGVEHADVVFSMEQVERVPKPKPELEAGSEDATMDTNTSLFLKLKESPEDLTQLAPAAGDEIIPLTGPVEIKDLSFCRPSSPLSTASSPKDLCTPELRQLLSPIFDQPAAPSPTSSSGDEVSMDMDSVEKFFAVRKEDDTQSASKFEDVESLDLDMLAPYISMDDDFQLTFLNHLPEPDTPLLEPAGPSLRKRILELDEDLPLKKTCQEKRQKHEGVLLSDALLGCLVDGDGTDELETLRRTKTLLATEEPPMERGLCDTAALMSQFLSRPADALALPLEVGPGSPLT